MIPPEIGKLERTYRPSAANLVAGVILGVLLIGAGATVLYLTIKEVIDRRGQLPFSAERDACWISVSLATAFGVGSVIGGSILVRWIRSLSSLQVHLGSDGFVVSRRDRQQVFPWDQIAYVKETHVYERPPVLKGPAKLMLPKIKSRRYLVRRDDEEEFTFDGNTLRYHVEFAEMLQAHLGGRNIPWEIVEEHV